MIDLKRMDAIRETDGGVLWETPFPYFALDKYDEDVNTILLVLSIMKTMDLAGMGSYLWSGGSGQTY